jgi:hypothetical protein
MSMDEGTTPADRAPATTAGWRRDARRGRPSGRLLARLVFAVVALLAAPGAVQAALTASIADLNLPAVTSSHVAQTSTGTMTLTVADTAPGAGWNVTILASPFAYSGAHGGTSIPAANLSVTEARNPVLVSGQAIDPSGGPKVPPSGATGALDVARKTIQAEAGYGGGTYTHELTVSLVVPADSRAGTYTSSLTVTVSAGP